jgi:hypothetical protein
MSVARDTCKRRIEKSPRISILTETEIEFLEGRSHLEEVTWVDRRDGLKTSKRIYSPREYPKQDSSSLNGFVLQSTG